ncbi:MAG: tetratricopeptide repeat protein [Planctomycetota bacterium]|nr:tetratricopeptide repeat protein [Planctomycetota bacterium]MDP6503143.1 tetratricopeptide repeat protein [Planctomycetota bacterium]
MEHLIQEALDLILAGHCEEALTCLDQVAVEELQSGVKVEFLYWRSYALSNLHRFEEAERLLRDGIREYQSEGRFFRSLGQLLSEAGRENESLIYFAKASELMPEDSTTAYEWGFALFKLERDDEAIEQFNDALTIDPKCADAIRYLGEIFCSREEYEQAYLSYRAYLHHNPDDHVILVEAAICLSDLEQFEEAFEYYERAANVNREYLYTYYNWSVSLWRSGDLDKAVLRIRECLQSNSFFPLGWMLLGRLQLALGNKENALKTMERAMKSIRRRKPADTEMVCWCYESYFETMIEMEKLEEAEAIFWECARSNILSENLLTQYNSFSSVEADKLCLWWILLDVRLYKPTPAEDLDGELAGGYLVGFNVLAHDPDEAVDYAIDFERTLSEGDALVEECLLRDTRLKDVPGVCRVYPNRNYYLAT